MTDFFLFNYKNEVYVSVKQIKLKMQIKFSYHKDDITVNVKLFSLILISLILCNLHIHKLNTIL